MSTTIIDNLFSPNDTPPAAPWFEAVGGRRADTGNVIPLRTDYQGHPSIIMAPSLSDCFSRVRGSQPYSLIDIKQVGDNAPFLLDTSLVGGGTATYSQNIASTQMTLTTASGDSVVRQSKQYAPYEPGRSQTFFLTGVMGALKTNVRQRIGCFDTNNGLFFQQDGTNLSVVRRTFTSGSAVDTAVNQSSWNLDKLDGTGPSGVTIDMSKMQVFVIDFAWLGAGGARFGFLLNQGTTGAFRIIYCHQISAANTLTVPFMSSPALPLRWEITNTGTTASSTTMTQTCGAAFSESGFDPAGVVASAAITSTSGKTVASATTVPLISVRLKSGYNRGQLTPLSFDVMSNSNQSWLIQVVINGTLTGASFGNTTSSATEFDTAATAISGGIVIASAFGSASGNRSAGNIINGALTATSNIAGTADIVSVVLTALTGNTTAWGSLTWEEIY